jgi:hypothetical protein
MGVAMSFLVFGFDEEIAGRAPQEVCLKPIDPGGRARNDNIIGGFQCHESSGAAFWPMESLEGLWADNEHRSVVTPGPDPGSHGRGNALLGLRLR